MNATYEMLCSSQRYRDRTPYDTIAAGTAFVQSCASGGFGNVVILCFCLSFFCRNHCNSGKMRHSENGFLCRDGDPYCCRAAFFMAYGIPVPFAGLHQQTPGKGVAVLVLSGLATGASWLCYFRALQLGDVNKVTPIDKSSTVLTMLLASIFLNEPLTLLKALCAAGIAAGTYLMIQKKEMPAEKSPKSKAWLFYALCSAGAASLTSILAKIGIEDVESNLATAIRTSVVLIMAWLTVFVSGKQHTLREIPGTEFAFICLSGIATGASWLCYYKALKDGPASIVVPSIN